MKDNMIKMVSQLNQTEIDIDLTQWGYLGNGQSHLALKNLNKKSGLYKNALVIPLHDISNCTYQFFNAIYQQVLASKPSISKALNQISLYNVNPQESQKICHYVNSAKFLKQELKIVRQIEISANLFCFEECEYDMAMQFKPKSPMPDFYSERRIKQFCEASQLSWEEITDLLNKNNVIQRSKWFKRFIHTKKGAMNPFLLFGFEKDQVNNYISKTNLTNTSPAYHQINNQPIIIDQINWEIDSILKNTGILEEILSLNFLFTMPLEFIEEISKKVSECSISTLKPYENELNAANIYSEIMRISKQCSLEESKERIKQIVIKSSIVPDEMGKGKSIMEELTNLLYFLISMTWRDISFIFRIKIAEEKTQEGWISKWDCKIIDYNLKVAGRLQKNMEKDEVLLDNYVKYCKQASFHPTLP